MIYLYNKGNYEGMKNELSKVDWSSIICKNQGTKTSYDSLLYMLGNLMEKYIPTKWLDGSKLTKNYRKIKRILYVRNNDHFNDILKP